MRQLKNSFKCLHPVWWIILLGISAACQPAPQESHMQPQSALAAHAGHNVPAKLDFSEFRVTKVTKVPENFMGGLVYDPAGKRLWLLSVGPPANTKTSSILYEVDPESGAVLAQAQMPFLGEFGSPALLDGYLYVGIAHESKLYKVEIADRAHLGKIVATVPLPTLNDLTGPITEPFRFPFINFPGLVATPDKHLLLHAEDLGLFLTIDPATGKILKEVRTMVGLGGTAGISGPEGEFLLLGNTNPQVTALKRDLRVFMFRSAHGFTPAYMPQTEVACNRQDARDITWALLDPQSGEVLASTLDRCSRTQAASVTMIRREDLPGFPYGKMTFLTVGEEGILTVEWRPR